MHSSTSTRRHFLGQQAFGLGGLALAWLSDRDALRAAPVKPDLQRRPFDLKPRSPAHTPQATAMISLFMQGGPSHMDLCDPKPELVRHHLQSYTGDIHYDNVGQASTKLFAGPWKFSRHGECGMELSELLPALGQVADDICLIRSMHTGISGHETGISAMNTGRSKRGRPSLGSWLVYGLGSVNQNMPAYLVLRDPTGLPVLGAENWQHTWLPPGCGGTVVRAAEPRIANLQPPVELRGAAQRRILTYLSQLNQDYLEQHPGEQELTARMQTYQLAAGMQVAAREALDLSRETAATHRLYGIDDPVTQDFGKRCLIARRLVERGVRFVQVMTGDQHWDHHGGIVGALPKVCRRTDKPAAALVRDLKRIGLLDTTLVHWGGEIGRLPVIQNEQNIGRDHNGRGFSMWLAGGGVKRGLVHGETDEVGHRAVTDVVNHYDYHATLFHLFGLAPQQVTYARPSGSTSLTDGQPGEIVTGILRNPPPGL
ncbi:MAG: hypothetical protein CMJ59_05595 [Planctomycetaceae bacterium]|nr:hypothetical protein [Planctomycetaceae bacterium]